MLMLLPLAPRLTAQAARVVGRVHDDVTGDPIPGAKVRLTGNQDPLETRTDTAGGYHFDRVAPGRVRFRVEAPRYTVLAQEIDIEPASVAIIPLFVTPIAVMLDRLQVQAEAVDRARERPGVVSGERVSGTGAPAAENLTARVAGARILFSGGAVGMATQILLRGFKSMRLPADPLYYVDGIPTAPPTAPSARNRSGEASILDLIDPSTIERIEIISGAAANAAFGLGSNNGVILIYTRRS